METIQAIRSRRSIRKYQPKPVPHEVIEQIVADAAYAPSWKNTQIARYIVVTGQGKEGQAGGRCMLGFAYNQKTTHGAPALVVLTMIKERSGYERDGSFSTPLAAHWQSF